MEIVVIVSFLKGLNGQGDCREMRRMMKFFFDVTCAMIFPSICYVIGAWLNQS